MAGNAGSADSPILILDSDQDSVDSPLKVVKSAR